MSPLTPEEAECARLVLTSLIPYIAQTWTFFLECVNNPDPNSAVGRAQRNRDLVLTLDVSLTLSAANDHYETFANVFKKIPIPRYSLYPVVRSALESDARACWALDVSIGDPERLARALTERANSLFEARRLGRKVLKSTPARQYAKRIKRVLKAGERWNLAHKIGKDGLVTFASRPKITPLISELLPAKSLLNRKMTVGQHTYAALSARAHSDPWALLDKPVSRVALNELQSGALVEVDLVELTRLLGVALQLHDEATKRMTVLSGFDVGLWEQKRGPWLW